MAKAIKLVGAAAALLFSITANAAPIQLQWTTTAQDFTGSIPGVNGEEITTTFTVDNGGTSTLSQTWDVSDFLSYRIEGASGWWIESDFISVSSSNGFSTDALGSVVTAGTWFSDYPSAITTSWAGDINGGWWNNGNNEVVCSTSIDCVYANNVNENIIGSNWTATTVDAPEPASFALLSLGLAGISLSRRRKA